jgi:hypothetical protein
MRFRFRRHHERPPEPASTEPALAALPGRVWKPSGIGDEIEAYLHGHLVDHLATHGRLAPAWTAVNRLAHATLGELAIVVAGAQPGQSHAAARRRPVWADTERFAAARLLARAEGDAAEVARIQMADLIPLELALVDAAILHGMDARDVLDAAVEALDSSDSPI